MSDNKEFAEIMQKITSGLTGDPQKDMKYLDEKSKEYKDHPMNIEILRACGRLMAQLIPEDKREELNRFMANRESGTKAALEEAKFNIYQKNFDKALSIIEGVIQSQNDLGFFKDDEVSEYHDFGEFFEEALYTHLYKPEKDLRNAPFPYTEAYLIYGGVLIDLKRPEDAQKAFEQGLKWNPVSFPLTSEYIETFKMIGQIDKYFELSLDAFKIAFRPRQIARCYRNLGYYFIEKELYKEAMGCYILSAFLDKESDQAQSEMYYIHTRTGGTVKEPTMDEITSYAQKYSFPIGPDKDVIGLAMAYGKHFMDNGQNEAAKYIFQIAYDLIHDEEIKGILDSLQ